MQTGTKISAVLHLGLLGAALFGGAFRSEPLPEFEVQDVTLISGAEFAALSGQAAAPDLASGAETPDAPPEPAAVPVAPAPDVVPDPATPDAVAAPDLDPAPLAPEPVAEPDPAPAPVIPPVPDPTPQAVVVTQSPRPKPRPVDRVAPQPVAAPPPDVTPDVDTTPQVSPDPGAETPQELQEATAPEEATDQRVTEADETSAELAPTRSPKPPSRPARRPTATETAVAQSPDTTAAVNAALAEALLGNSQGSGNGSEPSGPPLTAGEREDLRLAVAQCWNVGALSTAALEVVVIVGVEMTQDGKPRSETIRMISSQGGTPEATKQAYEAARRAIIRCGLNGFDLPPEKYDQWRDIEMTFNPETLR